jgi:hypothetical protein
MRKTIEEARMRKLKLAFALAVLTATVVSPKPAHACPQPVCDIICWYYPTQTCYQDSCCQLFCCDTSDPTCWTPCG